LAWSGSCCTPGTLLLDHRVNILPSEVAKSPPKTSSPDLRTNLRHLTTSRRLSHSPRTVLEVPGIDKSVNRNMTLVPRGGGTQPQKLQWTSQGLSGSKELPLCPGNRNEAPGSKIAPRAKHSFLGLIEFDPENQKNH
jgi:hypothetical protein